MTQDAVLDLERHEPGLWTPPAMPFDEILHMLFALGHFHTTVVTKTELKKIKAGSKKFKDAVESWQDYHGLLIDADFGEVSQEVASRRRCSLPDHMPDVEFKACGWKHMDVSCAQRLKLSSLTEAAIKRAWQGAVNNWNRVCGLEMIVIESLREANIYANSGKIDGRGGTLAWSYLVGCNNSRRTQMEQKYDNRESWSEGYLLEVMTHEIGHALGLSHGPRGAIMYAYATGGLRTPQKWDIAQVVDRYGKATTPPDPPDPPDPPGPGDPTLSVHVEGTINGIEYALVPKVNYGELV